MHSSFIQDSQCLQLGSHVFQRFFCPNVLHFEQINTLRVVHNESLAG